MSRWESLLVVQGHDTRVDQLAHRLDDAARAGALAEVEPRRSRALDGQRAPRSTSGAASWRAASSASRTRSPRCTERANQAEKQLYSGAVTNPRELQALQDDVASIRRRIGQLEDQELEIMELTEPVDAERAKLDGRARRGSTTSGSRSRAALAEAEADIEAELGRERERATRPRPDVPDDLWAEYDLLRSQLGGVAIARLVGSTCQGCHLALSAVEVDRIRKLGARRAGALRGVRSPARPRLTADVPCSSGSPAARSCWCGSCSAARPSTTGW